jgi:hypothetical protein
MKFTVFAVLAALTLTLAGASAQAQVAAPMQHGNNFNFVQGGGG